MKTAFQVVAQVSNLLYRRFPTCQINRPPGSAQAACRLEVGDTADGERALQRSLVHPASTLGAHSAFTMVEIALCLAIVSFAMVAIIGVLPMGLTVQKSNRDETIVNQEGAYLLETIRNGAVGLDELTNYVDWVSTNLPATRFGLVRSNFVTGREIVGLLSTPKYYYSAAARQYLSNTVVAKVRAASGLASAKSLSPAARDFAFSFLLQSEVVPFVAFPTNYIATNWTAARLSTNEVLARRELWAEGVNLQTNLYDVRLTLRWPVFEQRSTAGLSWKTGPNQKTFRTLVSGVLLPYTLNLPGQPAGQTLYFFTPSVF